MKKLEERLALFLIALFTGITILALLVILYHIISKGLPGITWEFLTSAPKRSGKLGGIYPMIVNTFYLTGLSLSISAPIGIGAAVFLTEYFSKGKLVSIFRFGIETLAGIPSIIFGLFGFLFFVIKLGWGWSLLSGSITLSLMILPTIIRTAEEAIRLVPDSYREGSTALGATKAQTIGKIVLPTALPGILTGVILGVGRAVGETAAVLFTAGSSLRIPVSVMDPARNLAVHLYIMALEGISVEKAYATATVLIVFVLIFNTVATRVITTVMSRNAK
jgi:phosphate transport system permease protein